MDFNDGLTIVEDLNIFPAHDDTKGVPPVHGDGPIDIGQFVPNSVHYSVESNILLQGIRSGEIVVVPLAFLLLIGFLVADFFFVGI